MKSIFTLFLSFISFVAYTQSQRDYGSFLGDTVGNTNGIEGIFEGPGEVTYIAENKFGTKACYSFLKTFNYNVEEKSHYRTPGSLFHPTSIVKMGQYLYVSAEYGSDSQKNYGLLKISATTGAPVLFKKINAGTNISLGIKLVQIPNSQELLLSYHTIGSDSTSQIHFFSLNPNLEATNYEQMLSFPTLKNQGYTTVDHTYDFWLDNSDIHYSIVFYDGNESRLETGNINMANNNINGTYSLLSNTAHQQKSKIALVKNGTIAYMADNSLFIRATNDSFFTKHSFNINFNSTNCFDLKQMPNDTWMVLFQSQFNENGYSPVGIFDTEELVDGIKIYYPTPSCSSIVTNGNNAVILGTINMNSTSIHEFQMTNFAYCNPSVAIYTINTSQVDIFDSQAAEVSIASYSSTNITLPTEVDVDHGDQVVCNPNHLGLSDNKFTGALHLFPNPTNDFIQIETENETIKQLELFDISGKCISTEKHQSSSTKSDVKNLPNGVYMIKIITESQTYTEKFIKN